MLKQARWSCGVLVVTFGAMIASGCSDDPAPGDSGAHDATSDLGHVDLASDGAGDAPGVDARQSAKTASTSCSSPIWIKPKHLTKALGTSSALGGKSYLWVITNPIVVTKQRSHL